MTYIRQPLISFIAAMFLILFPVFSSPAFPHEALRNGTVLPMGVWLQYREANFRGKPVFVHLRTGYERAIVLPELVELSNPTFILPATEIIITDNVVAFYPTITFTRRPVVFIGTETGTEYEFRIRASTKGMRQPMRLNPKITRLGVNNPCNRDESPGWPLERHNDASPWHSLIK